MLDEPGPEMKLRVSTPPSKVKFQTSIQPDDKRCVLGVVAALEEPKPHAAVRVKVGISTCLSMR